MDKLKYRTSRDARAQHIQVEFEMFINTIKKCKEKYTVIQLEKNSVELSEYVIIKLDFTTR